MTILPAASPDWAIRQRHLIRCLNQVGPHYVKRYVREDGTLIWRDEWPGMDGSDDGYESFFNFPLFYALGGSEEIHRISRFEWEAITRQFAKYGQIREEFDAYYDWMHHGESLECFYYFGLADPTVSIDRDRAKRFAALYMDEAPDAPNYDPALKLIRSPITGSAGPRFVNSPEDWVTHRPILANYPPPFEDIPGVSGPLCDWNNDAIFDSILRLMNERMMSGDVPLNLTSTSLITHAYLYTGEEKYRRWVLDYVGAWIERTRRNHGILPDNVGLSGEIGECMDGKWWGGYYGWRWPHGFNHLMEAVLIAASNALLLTGDDSWLDFPRSQMDHLYELGREERGNWVIPHHYGDRGWYGYQPMNPTHAIYLWSLSQSMDDRDRVERIRSGAGWVHLEDYRGKGEYNHSMPWYAYVQGDHPTYPEEIMNFTFREIQRRLEAIRQDEGADPALWDAHHWQDRNPVGTEALTQLTLGAPQTLYHGGLLHAPLRYFDPVNRRAGLPEDVSACVETVKAKSVTLSLSNVSPLEGRKILIQAGAFGEHAFAGATIEDSFGGYEETPFDGRGGANDRFKAIEIALEPGKTIRLRLALRRHAFRPGYDFPWKSESVPFGSNGRMDPSAESQAP